MNESPFVYCSKIIYLRRVLTISNGYGNVAGAGVKADLQNELSYPSE